MFRDILAHCWQQTTRHVHEAASGAADLQGGNYAADTHIRGLDGNGVEERGGVEGGGDAGAIEDSRREW